MAGTPNREQIELRAYEIYEERGREDGHALEHWVAAEQEVSSQQSAAPKPGHESGRRVAQAMQKPAAARTNR
jgi:hypothetical protein